MSKLQKGRNLIDYTPQIPAIKMPGKQLFAESRVNKGMVTTLDPADIEPGALQLAQNCRVRFDKTSRREGTILLTPTKPDSDDVIGTYYLKKNDGIDYVFRFTNSAVHERGVTWTAYGAGVGGSLTGGAFDYIRAIVAFDDLYFTNNGADVIRRIDVATQEYLALGNAPKVKYITGFFNRIVGANRTSAVVDPTEVVWSGTFNNPDGGLLEWDTSVDETAGSNPLVQSPADRSDFITGIFAFTNVLVILRERSIWLANKQPIPTFPFNFYAAFPGVGCDAPQSAVITLNGLTWVDSRSGTVWFYQPGTQPEPIGRPIEKDLMRGLDDPAKIFASYAPVHNEYTVCIPQVGSNLVIAWTYNFRTKAWVRDIYESITFIQDIDLTSGTISIDDLSGEIKDLVGTIDELSPSADTVPVRVFGRKDGEIIEETADPAIFTDPPVGGGLGILFTTELVFKTFSMPSDDVYVVEVRLELIVTSASDLILTYSRDGGKTFNSNSKTMRVTAAQIGEPILFRWNKQVKARRFTMKLSSDGGQFDVIGYEIHVNRAGKSHS